MTELPPKEALLKIDKLLAELNFPSASSPDFKKWRLDCLRLISQVDGANSPTHKAFEGVDFEEAIHSALTVRFLINTNTFLTAC